MGMPSTAEVVTILTLVNSLVLGVAGFFKHKERKARKAAKAPTLHEAANSGPMAIKPRKKK